MSIIGSGSARLAATARLQRGAPQGSRHAPAPGVAEDLPLALGPRQPLLESADLVPQTDALRLERWARHPLERPAVYRLAAPTLTLDYAVAPLPERRVGFLVLRLTDVAVQVPKGVCVDERQPEAAP